MINRFRPLALVVTMLLLGAWACTASASDSTDAQLAQVSKKKSCKKKSGKRAAPLAGVQTAKKKKKKCKRPAGDPAKTPLSVKITSCPTGAVSGSNVATITGTSAVGPHLTTYITFNRVDSYLDTPVLEEVRVYPNASGAWSYSFTPGFPESWEYTQSWDQRVSAWNYRAHDGVYAECFWTVTR
jgi:hypothetical protein